MTQHKTAAPPVQILGDSPPLDNLVFGFDAYADTLAGMIACKANATPMVMGIYGSRGVGKTTLLKAIKARLDGDTLSDGQHYRRCKTVWFQAWKNRDRDEIPASLTEAVLKAMAADGFFSLARTRIDTVTRRFDKSAIYASISKLVTGVDISEFFSGLTFRKELGHFETFQRFFDDLVWTFLNWRFKLADKEKPDDRMGAMVIFIDDLDQCPSSRIILILETIKLCMDRCGCIFVLGAGNETLQNALATVHGQQQGRELMDKIVQVGFKLPRILPEEFVGLVEESFAGSGSAQVLGPHLSVIMPALGYNPRQLKRLVNSLNLLCALLGRRGVTMEFEKALSWWMLTHIYKDMAGEIKDNPDRLAELRGMVSRLMDKFPEIPVWQLNSEQFEAESIPASLSRCLQQRHLSEILMGLDLTATQLRGLSSLSGSVELPGKTS
jgi:gamma-glutamyl hercynylcysteine S-oxide synthase